MASSYSELHREINLERFAHNDSKWASQFRQHGITAAALSASKVKQNKVHLNLRNLLEFGAQRNGSSTRHWKKPKQYHCDIDTLCNKCWERKVTNLRSE